MKCNLLILILFSGLIANCSKNEEGFGTFYEGSYIDYLRVEMPCDSFKITIEQLASSSIVDGNITYEIENDASMLDMVKMELSVDFGSYSPEPNPFKDLISDSTTIYIWYAHIEKPGQISLNKSTAITGIPISPKLDYYSIQKIKVIKSERKEITFESMVFQ